MPAREKGKRIPVRSLHVPSHVPSHPQTAAKVRGFSPTAPGRTAEIDSLLEGGVRCELVSAVGLTPPIKGSFIAGLMNS